MDWVVAIVEMGFLENLMNGMDLIGLVNHALMGHAHAKKSMMVYFAINVQQVSLDITVQMVL